MAAMQMSDGSYIYRLRIYKDAVAGGFWLPDGRRVEYVVKPAALVIEGELVADEVK